MKKLVTNKPIEQGNASMVHEVCFPMIELMLVRYEAIADFLADEPCLIHIYPESGEDKIVCEKILSFYIDVPNNYSVTYAIYSNKRSDFSQDWYSVVRKVYWDKKNDQSRIKEYPDQRDELLQAWPSVIANNIAIRQCVAVKEIIHGVDTLIETGIVISHRKGAFPYWNNIAMMRKSDWGEVRFCWDASQQNEILEEYTLRSIKILGNIFNEEHPVFHKLALDYQIPLETFRKAIMGAPTK